MMPIHLTVKKQAPQEGIWSVEVGFYSLKEGCVGQPVDKPFVVRNHDNAVDALLDLDNSINTNEGSEPPPAWIAATMLIIMPDGRRLGFDDVYTETFGAYPVRQDNRENLYPKLRKAALKKGKKR